MALAVDSAAAILKHALRYQDVDPVLGGAMAAINRAGRLMTGLRNWRYLRRIATLDLTAGQNYVPLPADFAQLDAQEASQAIVGAVSLVSDDELIRLRENTASSGGSVYQAAIFARDNPSSLGGAPSWVLELDRTVETTMLAAFTIVYRSDWVDVSTGNAELSFPPYMDELFLQILRAYVQDYQHEHMSRKPFATLDERLAQIEMGATFAIARRFDQGQHEFGDLRGGHVAGDGVYRDWGSNAVVADIT